MYKNIQTPFLIYNQSDLKKENKEKIQLNTFFENIKNVNKSFIKNRDVSKTDQYRLMVEHGAMPLQNIDRIFKLNTGVIIDNTQGKYLVECGKHILQCETTNNEYEIGEEVKVFTNDGKRGDIKMGIAHGELQDSLENKTPILLKNITHVKGGFKAEYKGVAIFIPGSLIAFNICKDFSEFDGKDVEVIIISRNNERNRFTGDVNISYTASRKDLLKILSVQDFKTVISLPRGIEFTGTITGFLRNGDGVFVEFDEYYLNGFISNLGRKGLTIGDPITFTITNVNNRLKRLYLTKK